MYRHIADAGGAFVRDLLRAEMELFQMNIAQLARSVHQIIKDTMYA